MIEVAVGDKLLLTANRSEPGPHTTNGEIVSVAAVDQKSGIRLEDGRELPADFGQFSYGYAVTAHRSQGKSVDSVIISEDGMQKELFYVAASRGREAVQVITSDKELLRDSVGRSGARQSACELARKVRPGLQQRIGLDVVVYDFRRGRSAEAIFEAYPSLGSWPRFTAPSPLFSSTQQKSKPI